VCHFRPATSSEGEVREHLWGMSRCYLSEGPPSIHGQISWPMSIRWRFELPLGLPETNTPGALYARRLGGEARMLDPYLTHDRRARSSINMTSSCLDLVNKTRSAGVTGTGFSMKLRSMDVQTTPQGLCRASGPLTRIGCLTAGIHLVVG
jgi:hypothetical protein